MDDDFDILAQAIESIENETDTGFRKDNTLNESSNNRENDSTQETVNPSEQQALSSVIETEKHDGVRTLVGVDLNFEEIGESPPKVVEKVNVKKKRENVKSEKSAVHTGDTDSSDDEDNKYFEEKKYDSFGKFIKSQLKMSENSTVLSNKVSSWRKNTSDTSCVDLSKGIKKVVTDVSADPIFGIRIVNPLVSSQIIKEKMVGRTPVSFAKVKSHVAHGDLNNDWVIAAVIVKKLPPRVSQNGNNYSSWILSDLKHDLKSVFLFLFGKAHQDLWKTAAGSVLAILNPSVLNDKKSSEYEAKLSIKSPDQVMIWGRSKDLGQCKVIKKNGEMCGAYVNTYLCEVCVYHVKQEYNKTSRPQFSLHGNLNLRNKVLGKNEVFYGGKSFTAIAPTGNKKKVTAKDVTRIQGLGGIITETPQIVSIPNLQRSNEILKMLPSVRNPLRNNKSSDKNRLDELYSKKATIENTDSYLLKKSSNNCKTSTKQPGLNSPLNTKPCTADEVVFKSALPGLKLPTLSNPESDFLNNKKCNVIKEKSPSLSSVKSDKKLTPRQGRKSKVDLQKRFTNLLYLNSEIKEERQNDTIKQTIPMENYKPESFCPKSADISENIDCDNLNSTLNQKEKFKRISKVNNTKTIESVNKEKLNVNENRLTCHQSPQTPTQNKVSINEIKATKTSPMNAIKIQNSAGINNSPTLTMSKAKMKALLYVKSKGPINKENPSKIKCEGKKVGVKRPFPSEEEEGGDKKKSVLSERFIQLMNQKSLHEDLIELREYEQEMEYFDKMEKKDRLEEKMLNTYKVDCKAVKCLKCNYLWFSAADACKSEGHPLKVIDAVKRFFKCGHCENRTVSLTIIPLLPCKKCSCTNWIRTAMIKEKIAKTDGLSIRGGEQKFMNSVVTNSSLNLLVPDE